MDNTEFAALNRFGFGRRPDEPLPADPHGWLSAQLDGPDPVLADPTLTAGLPDCNAALAMVQVQLAKMREMRAEGIKAHGSGVEKPVVEIARAELHAMMATALITQAPFRERLVWFWANHFSITARGPVDAGCAGAYVREAIRPYVTGKFADMLLAVIRHPAMLAYLNNSTSVGPNSRAGLAHHLGLNENLGRECLELHTVSPAAGYTQEDVTNFAKILTGWSIELKLEPRGFKFRPAMHEPGEIEVMGRVWPEGQRGGVEILAWLGTHPATYHHLAEKLVRHFVSDSPPRDQVLRIARVLQDTGGDLGAASQAVLEIPAAWHPGTKLRTPQDYVIACARALNMAPETMPNLAGLVHGLGQGLFQAPFPIGWPDRAVDWGGPESILQRVDFAFAMAGRGEAHDPAELAHAVLGPNLRPATLAQIQSAGSRRDAITLAFASPEFQRR